MKKQIIVEAKTGRTPFIKRYSRYEVLEETEKRYKIRNELGKESYENKEFFFPAKETHEYGWAIGGALIKGVMSPVFTVFKEDDELIFGIGIFCFVGILSYTFKKKVA